MTIPTGDELKERALDLKQGHIDLQRFRESCDVASDILTTLANVSDLEPDSGEDQYDSIDAPFVTKEYADHWRNKAMQLAVKKEQLQSEYSKARTAIQDNYAYIERLRQQLAEAHKLLLSVDVFFDDTGAETMQPYDGGRFQWSRRRDDLIAQKGQSPGSASGEPI